MAAGLSDRSVGSLRASDASFGGSSFDPTGSLGVSVDVPDFGIGPSGLSRQKPNSLEELGDLLQKVIQSLSVSRHVFVRFRVCIVLFGSN